MPKLSREELCVLVGVRRLLVLIRASCAPQADPDRSAVNLILKELTRMSDTFDLEMTKLRGDVAAQGTVIASATEAFRGLAAQLVAAEAAAKNAGATDDQIAGVSTLRQQLEANTASLAAAIPANTDAVASTPVAASDPSAPVPTPPAAAPAPVVTAPAAAADPAAAAASSSVPADAPVVTAVVTPVTDPAVAPVDPAALAANQAR